MKVMMLTKMAEATGNRVPPSEEAILAMHNYNEALIAAGILKDQVYGGLMPSSFGKLLKYSGKNLTVISEVVAMNHLLRMTGVDSAAAFNDRLIRRMKEQRGLRQYLQEDFE